MNKRLSIIYEFLALFLTSLIFGYSAKLQLDFFSSGLANTSLIFSSIFFLILSFIPTLVDVMFVKKYLSYSEILDYPTNIQSEKELLKWKNIAYKIKIKKNDLSYNMLFALLPIYLGWVLLSIALIVSSFFTQGLIFLNIISVSNQELFSILLLFLLAPLLSFIPMLLFLELNIFLVEKYLLFPNDKDVILAESLIISYRLKNEDRLGAQKEIPLFLASLRFFDINFFNKQRKIYSEEFSFLRKNSLAIKRMLSFSSLELSVLSDLFLNFGLSLRNWDSVSCYEDISALINETKKFRPAGRIEKALGRIEAYPKTISLLIPIIMLIVSVLVFYLGYPQIAGIISSGV